MGKRRAWVLLAVQVLILVHVLLWLVFGRTIAPLEPSESMAFAKEGIVNPGLILFALAILATLVFGRFFCGWGCHLLALQDGYRWLLQRFRIPVRPFRSRLLRLVPVAAFIYMFLWPFLYRIGNDIPHPGIAEVEMTTTAFWQTFPGFWDGLLTLFLAGAYVVQVMGTKSFCTYACPYGAVLSVADAFAPGSIRVDDSCKGCGKCTAVCSSGVRVHEEVRDFGMVISTDCMKTMDCVAACPNQALHYAFGMPATFQKRRAQGKESKVGIPTWPEELLLAVFFAFGFFATEGLYAKVSFLLALAFGMVTAIFALQVKRAFTQENYRPGPKAWRKSGRWLPHGRMKLLLVSLPLLLVAHSAFIQFHSVQRDAAFAHTMNFRNAWLSGQAQLPAPEEVRRASAAALIDSRAIDRYGLLDDARDGFVSSWDLLFAGDVVGFEQGLLEVLDARPGFGEVLFQLGRHQSLMGRHEEAIHSWSQVSPRDPRYFDVRLDMILENDAIGRPQEAEAIRAELLQRGYPQEALTGRIPPDDSGHSH
jgi:polyferredoxin